jgi:hypothetical protein
MLSCTPINIGPPCNLSSAIDSRSVFLVVVYSSILEGIFPHKSLCLLSTPNLSQLVHKVEYSSVGQQGEEIFSTPQISPNFDISHGVKPLEPLLCSSLHSIANR